MRQISPTQTFMLRVLRINKQSLMNLTWAHNNLHINWVWRTAKPVGSGFDSSSNSRPLGFSIWLA